MGRRLLFTPLLEIEFAELLGGTLDREAVGCRFARTPSFAYEKRC
jgi:hypothetical protein